MEEDDESEKGEEPGVAESAKVVSDSHSLALGIATEANEESEDNFGSSNEDVPVNRTTKAETSDLLESEESTDVVVHEETRVNEQQHGSFPPFLHGGRRKENVG